MRKINVVLLFFIYLPTSFASLDIPTIVEQKSTVGYYRNSNNNLAPLSYISSNGGATWSLGNLLPLPIDVASNGIQNSELQGVGCDSTQMFCRAVGFYLNTGNNFLPLGYTSINGGASWTLSNRMPLPADIAATGVQNTRLQSVVCSNTGTQCGAVGFYLNSSNNVAPISYTSSNSGVTWSLSAKLPLPSSVAASGIQNSTLLSIACNNTGLLCRAVGGYLTSGNNIMPLGYTSTNGGASWSLSDPLLLPTDVAANGMQQTWLYNIACDTAGSNCNAVGAYLDSRNNTLPLAYASVNGGKSWVLANKLPLPANSAANGIRNSQLFSTACSNSGLLCRAVGFYLNNSNNMVPSSFTSSNGGLTWSLSNPLALPVNVAGNGVQNTKLRGIACDSSGVYCNAVGFYLNTGNNLAPISYTSENGGASWSLGNIFALPANVAGTGVQATRLFAVGRFAP